MNDSCSRRRTWRRVLTSLPIIASLVSVATAQTLNAEPWPPRAERFDLVGRGFPVQKPLDLEFGDPKPVLRDGKAVPSKLTTNATGGFRLSLVAKGRLTVRAVLRENGGERSVSLLLPTSSSAASSSPPPVPITVQLEGGALRATRGGVSLWTADTQSSLPPVTLGEKVVSTEGTSLLARDLQTGNVVWRAFLSGPITTLEQSGSDIRAIVTHAGDADGTGRSTEPFTVRDGKPIERVTFAPSKALLDSLEVVARRGLNFDPLRPTNPAEAVRVMRERLGHDPTNPFIAVFLGAALERERETTEANATFARALEIPAPFYASIRLAALLDAIKRPELADRALESARTSWAKAGYDPGFRVGRSALSAWGDPLEVARQRFREGDAVRGTAWMSFLRATMPRFAGYERADTEFAAWLESQGRPGEASDWRAFTSELAQGTPFKFGEESLSRVASLALAAVVALLAAYLALQITLAAKYWIAQGRDLRPHGGRWGAWSRSPLLRVRHSLPAYHSLTEKLVLLVLLALAALGLIVWTWALRGNATLRATPLNAGTFGGEAFYSSLTGLPQGPKLEAVRGLAFQLDAQTERAAEAYRNAPLVASAQNNLGVIAASRGDQAGAQAAYREALRLESNAVAPRWNLGLNPNGYRVAFHNAFNPNSPMLSVPEPTELLEASVGDLGSEFARFTADPWIYLTRLPLKLPDWAPIAEVPVIRIGVAVAVLVLIGLSLVWLVVPRVRGAQLAPRGLVYEFLALIVPGSGLADEVWGVLLIVPWAVLGGALAIINLGPALLGTGLMPGLLASSSPLGLVSVAPVVDLMGLQTWLYVILGAIYAVNFVAWLIEAITFRRRLRSSQAVPPTAPSP